MKNLASGRKFKEIAKKLQKNKKFSLIFDFVIKNKVFFASFFVLGGYYFTWWLAYYPGTYSPDSIDQLAQATSLHFINSSPYLYALIMSFFVHLFNKPALMGILQIGLITTTVSLFLSYTFKKLNNKKLIFIYLFLLLFLPYISIFNVTIWKDVLYSYVVLATMLLLFVLITNFELAKKTQLLFLLATLTSFAVLLRFNGFIFLLLVPLSLFVTKSINLKKLSLFVAAELVVYLFFSVFLFQSLHVADAPLMKEGIYLKLAGAVLNYKDADISSEERQLFYRVLPEDYWKKYYTCEVVDYLFYQGLYKYRSLTMWDALDKDTEFVNRWHKAAITASIRNPIPIIKDKACIAQYLLGYKATYYKYEKNVFGEFGEKPVIVSSSKIPILKKIYNRYLEILTAGSTDSVDIAYGQTAAFIEYLIWSAMIQIGITTSFFILAIKKHLKGILSYTVISFINIGATVALMPATNFRYVYPLFLMTLMLPALYLLEIKTVNTDKE